MARGRIIVTAITKDKAVSSLSDDTSRLAFTWLVTFADSAGRTYGDPAVVRSMLFPRREDISIAQMERYITEWAACGLVLWYEAEGDMWIVFPSFSKHQVGFDGRHEALSTIPVPPDVQSTAMVSDIVRTMPVQCTSEMKRSEVKRSEVKGNEVAADAAPLPPPAAATKPSPKSKPIPYTPDQLRFLESFNAKRFANGVQADTVAKLLTNYPAQFWEGVTWTAERGLAMGQAVSALKTALPKWGNPKEQARGANRRDNGNDSPQPAVIIPPLDVANRVRKAHGGGPVTQEQLNAMYQSDWCPEQ